MASERMLSITIIRDLSEDIIHPRAYDAFRRLAHTLELDHRYGKLGTLFKPFESYRHPYRQADLYRSGRERRPYQSAHQFGFAVDFVPYENNRWTWDKNKPWDALAERARACGLVVPHPHEPSHVEHPYWQDYVACLRAM